MCTHIYNYFIYNVLHITLNYPYDSNSKKLTMCLKKLCSTNIMSIYTIIFFETDHTICSGSPRIHYAGQTKLQLI